MRVPKSKELQIMPSDFVENHPRGIETDEKVHQFNGIYSKKCIIYHSKRVKFTISVEKMGFPMKKFIRIPLVQVYRDSL